MLTTKQKSIKDICTEKKNESRYTVNLKRLINLRSIFADFALQLDLDDDRLIEGIGQGTSMTFEELSDEEKKKIEYFSSTSLYDKEYPMGGVTRRAYEYEKWFAHLLTIVNERVKQFLKEYQK